MEIIKELGSKMFSSLSIRNYRLYFIGQAFSHVGNWMQTVALGWLVLEVTGSGTALGTMLALRFAPLLFGAPFAGNLIDSMDKRTLLYTTQWMAALLALGVSALVFADVVQVWMLYAAAIAFGVVDAVDRPLRQTFVHEMVGPVQLRNAVTLSSTEANVARALGPLFAGVLIATVGIAFCFFANTLSFLVVIFFLTRVRPEEFHKEAAHTSKGPSDILSGLRYAASVPAIRLILIMMAVIGTFSYEFQVSLPIFARQTFAGSAADYAALLAAMGVGSVMGGLFMATRQKVTASEFVVSALLFGLSMCVTATMPTLSYAVIGMVLVGFFSINLSSVGNTIVQLESASYIRGRVMALWTMALFGSTLVGAPLIGLISEYGGARWSIALGGFAAVCAAGFGALPLMRKDKLQSVPADVATVTDDSVGSSKL